MSRKVLVPVADGCEEIEAVTIVDVLRRAGAQVTVASVDDLRVTASRGVKLVADRLVKECLDESFDLVVLPGGMPGAEHLRDSPELAELLKGQKEQRKLYGAICAAPAVVLEHHGLLEGLRATGHPSFAERLDRSQDADSRVVVDGGCATSQGPGTAMEFALKLVELLYDKAKADDIARAMVVKED